MNPFVTFISIIGAIRFAELVMQFIDWTNNH